MGENDAIERIMKIKTGGRRIVGILKNRWIGGILKDVKYLKIRNWGMLARNIEVWRGILREALGQFGPLL